MKTNFINLYRKVLHKKILKRRKQKAQLPEILKTRHYPRKLGKLEAFKDKPPAPAENLPPALSDVTGQVTCTAVCKTWKSLIQNPTFISNHLHHSSNNKHPLLLFRLCSLELAEAVSEMSIEENEKEQYVLHFDNQDFNEYTRFDDFPLHGRSYQGTFRVVGTCNGLIFLADYLFDEHYNKFFLFNPCVRKFVKLPIPYITCSSRGGNIASVGFGFDPKTNDYKVVRFVTLEEKGRRGKVQVYSLSTGKWRMVTALPPVGAAPYSDLNVFVNGALHWVAFRKTENELLISVMVFDLGEEVFREIALPKLSDQNGDENLGEDGIYFSVWGFPCPVFSSPEIVIPLVKQGKGIPIR